MVLQGSLGTLAQLPASKSMLVWVSWNLQSGTGTAPPHCVDGKAWDLRASGDVVSAWAPKNKNKIGIY